MTSKHTHKGKDLEEIWNQVPIDYYQAGIKKNILQRIWHTGKLKHVIKAIKDTKENPKNILDAGSASGWFLSELSKSFPKSECIGIDIYEGAITYGKKKYKNIRLFHADVHDMPFTSGKFDTIVCCEVLEHVVDPSEALKELKRVVVPGGKVIVEIDTGNFLFKLIWFWWTTLRRGVWRDSHIHTFDMNLLEKLFVDNGFKIVRKKVFNFSMAVVYTLQPVKKTKK